MAGDDDGNLCDAVVLVNDESGSLSVRLDLDTFRPSDDWRHVEV